MEKQKYSVGEIVYDTIDPERKLVVTQIMGKLYQCKPHGSSIQTPVVYGERELKGEKE